MEGENALGTIEVSSKNEGLLLSTVVNEEINVVLPDFKSLTVYDNAARKILTSDQAATNVNALPKGNYHAVITTKSGAMKSVKFVKR